MMNYTNLLAEFTDSTAASSPSTPTIVPADGGKQLARTRGNPAPISEDQLRVMIGEARRDVRRQSGLVGQVMHRLRGDDLQRRQYAKLLRQIDGWDATEEAKLAVFLIISLQVIGFQIALSGLQEMEDHLHSFAPESAAARAGQHMLAEQITSIPDLVEEILQRGQRATLRPFGLDR